MAKSRARGAVSAQRPIAGPEAFSNLSEPSHVQSQAATMLLIGAHLRGDPQAAQARTETVAALAGRQPVAARALPREDLERLGFPAMPIGTARFHPRELQRALGVRFTARATGAPASSDVRAVSRGLPESAAAFYRSANAETAAALLEAGLRHPHPLVRVAAAASYFEVATDARQAIRVLESGVKSRDLLVRDVAATALGHVDPANPELRTLLKARRRPSKRKPSRTSTIVHGTWAANSSWWQPPSGDFWKYLHDNVDSSLYGASDRFGWTGGYSDAARADGGTSLHDWVQQHNLEGLDLFTHSHGGSVAMLASQAGMKVRRMALLSCPVHWPKYMPDFNLTAKVVSIRVHMDLVILADRGGQRFNDSRIQENVLPIWFDHFATHNPANWQKYNVPAML